MRRRIKVQWVLVTVLITFTITSSLFYRSNYVNSVYMEKVYKSTTAATMVLPVNKHVTKSLSQLGKMDEINRHFLFFNSIPQSGAEVLIFLLEKLQGFNNYRHVRLKDGTERRLSEIEQEELVYEMYNVIRNEAVPLSFDKHVFFVNFTLYDKQQPTYINLIRDPADKFFSSYANSKKRKEILKCIVQKNTKCIYKSGDIYDLNIPYFCGHSSQCSSRNNEWALAQAKRTIERSYAVVGVLDELNATLEVLESKVSYFFRGVQKTYRSDILDKYNKKTRTKPIPKRLQMQLRDTLSTEYDFYEWVKRRLFNQLRILYGDHNSH